ncbi:hypothetical protein [Saccharothrix carnea]|uniref:hypothetical protein n=1 Tax=Saccharothrix carnea TaxID=1280637 RepID=UPI0011B1DF4C|nr:hypothetical protein [Saccharothrix carnea]
MHEIIAAKRPEVEDLCRVLGVRRRSGLESARVLRSERACPTFATPESDAQEARSEVTAKSLRRNGTDPPDDRLRSFGRTSSRVRDALPGS